MRADELQNGTRIHTFRGVKTVKRVVDVSDQFLHPRIRVEFRDGTHEHYLPTAVFVAAN